jgi:hypothetical protein
MRHEVRRSVLTAAERDLAPKLPPPALVSFLGSRPNHPKLPKCRRRSGCVVQRLPADHRANDLELPDLVGIGPVWVGAQHDEVGQFPRPDRALALLLKRSVRTVQRADPQRLGNRDLLVPAPDSPQTCPAMSLLGSGIETGKRVAYVANRDRTPETERCIDESACDCLANGSVRGRDVFRGRVRRGAHQSGR